MDKKDNMKIAAKCAPIEERMKLVEKTGFKNLELYTSRELLTKKNTSAAKKFDFEYVVHGPTDYIGMDAVDFANSIGAKIVLFHNSNKTDLPKILDYAKSHGITLCVENHNVRIFTPHNAEEFFKLKKKFPGLKMLLDTEHAIRFGVFPNIVREVGSDIKHIHLTGSPPSFHAPPQANPEQTKKIISELRKIKYNGMVTAETHMKYFDEKTLIETRTFLESLV